MKRYSAAVVRKHLAEALDQADRGVPVIIERRGVRYRLALDTGRRSRRIRRSHIEILDPAIARGAWAWDWSPEGLTFRGRRR